MTEETPKKRVNETLKIPGKCHCCGGPVSLKINKNGKVYYFCGNFIRDETGLLLEDATGNPMPCMSEARYGGAVSKKLIAQNAKLKRGEEIDFNR